MSDQFSEWWEGQNAAIRHSGERKALLEFLHAASASIHPTNGEVRIPYKLREILFYALADAAQALSNEHISEKSAFENAGKVLLQELGLVKGGGAREANRLKHKSNTIIGEVFNIGKNSVSTFRGIENDVERLEQYLPRTIELLYRFVKNSNESVTIAEATSHLRYHMKIQFQLLSEREIDAHITKALTEAHLQKVIETIGSTIRLGKNQ